MPICGFVTSARDPSDVGPFGGDFPDVDDPHAEVANRLRETPVWIFHGESDTVVPVEESRGMFDALRAAGSPVKYSELPGTGHNSWDAAYGSPSMAEWLFQQRRP